MDTYRDMTSIATDGSADTHLTPAAAVVPSDDPSPESGEPEDMIAIVVGPVSAPTGWSDPQTGTDGPRFWDRLILSESARVRRYKRPATVVLVEIMGLATIAKLWGPKVVENTLSTAARTLAREIRTSDHIARVEPVRFGLLLTETNEIAAINFVERARAACDRDLHVPSEVVRVAFGWASPPKGGDLSDALALAARRLEADRSGD
jgi:diguanylate cyclase (GGDEF)-like protein